MVMNKRLVNLMGGEIEVDEGSNFWFELELATTLAKPVGATGPAMRFCNWWPDSGAMSSCFFCGR